MMPKYWILVASHEHVQCGIAGGFAQVCHGKRAPLVRISAGDLIIYYSPTQKFGSGKPYRYCTAIGRVVESEPYQHQMSDDFIPWRIDVQYLPATPVSIEPLLSYLSFAKNKRSWGLPLRRGIVEITKEDFTVIANAMGAL